MCVQNNKQQSCLAHDTRTTYTLYTYGVYGPAARAASARAPLCKERAHLLQFVVVVVVCVHAAPSETNLYHKAYPLK
jgi:hypothetical protein